MTFSGTLLTVMLKELRDLARDRRTLLLILLLSPLLYPVLMFGASALSENRIKTQIDKTLDVPVINQELAPNLMAFLAAYGIRAVDAPADLESAIRRQDIDIALRIDAHFPEDWRAGRPAHVEILRDSTRRDSDIPAARLQSALDGYSRQVGALRLLARGIDASVAYPLAVGRYDLATREARRSTALAALLPFLLILSSFLGGAYLILDATAGERERQTLEPLLTTPAARGAIVSGKIAAACLIGLMTLLLTLLAFKVSAQLASGIARQLDVSFGAIARMLFILLPMLFIGTTLLTLLAASAKSMKEAQSHMTWLMLLPMIPTFALMINPVKNQLWQFAVPFLAQNQMLLKVIRHEPIDTVTWAVYLVSGFLLTLVLWYLAVRRYRQEQLAIST